MEEPTVGERSWESIRNGMHWKTNAVICDLIHNPWPRWLRLGKKKVPTGGSGTDFVNMGLYFVLWSSFLYKAQCGVGMGTGNFTCKIYMLPVKSRKLIVHAMVNH